MKKKYSLLISFACVLVLIGLDQLTKWLCNTNETLLSGDKIIVIKNIISFRLAYNKGAAWSILEGQKFLLVTISLLASAVITFMIVKLVDLKNNLLLSIALILIDAGSIGNLIDRVLYGYVIDFLYFSLIDFPVFNVADIYITVSAILLMILGVFYYKEEDYELIFAKKQK